MVLHYPGPWTVELEYVYDGLSHTAAFNVNLTSDPTPGTPFASIGVFDNQDDQVALSDRIDAFTTLYANFFTDETQFVSWTLWKNVLNSYERTYRASHVPNEAVGLNTGGPNVPAGQLVHSYRSAGGNIAKMMFLEGISTGNTQEALPTTGMSIHADMANWVLGDDGIFIARDDTRLVAPLRLSRGQNERVFRKRFR